MITVWPKVWFGRFSQSNRYTRRMPQGLRLAFVLVALFTAPWGASQPSDGAETLREIRIEGTTSFADIVRVVLEARPGRTVDSVDLEAERNRVYSLGTFRSVSVSIEEVNVGPVLVVRVEENPLIAEVRFEGAEQLSPDTLRDALAREHLLSPGRVLNTTRAEEAIPTIQRLYRQRGFPFDVPVALELAEVETDDGVRVRLEYRVTETAPVRQVEIEESAIFEPAELREPFAAIAAAGTFDFASYERAVDALQQMYRSRGYRASGVDVMETRLESGTLQVALHEARIASIDTSALGVDPSELTLGVGDLFNYDVLLEDVRRLAQGRSGDIRLGTALTATGDVLVVFEQGPPDTAGPVDRIEFEGNTVLGDDQLREVLALREGDTFTSTLAREDFDRIVRRYAADGYVVLNQPDFSFVDGTYIQRITEVKIGGHRVTYDGDARKTQEFVIERYLPDVGSVLNQNQLRASLQQIARLGVVEPLNVAVEPIEGAPDQVTLNVLIRETRTGVFTPSAQYSTDSGLSASLTFSESNLLGRAHDVSAELNAQTSDLGFMVGGIVSYSVPWLYLDVLDFQEVPTSLSASVFSLVETNQLLTADGATRSVYPGYPDTEENRVLVGEYSRRDTGLSFSVGRPIFDFTTLRVNARGSVTEYKLEPPDVTCTFEGGEVANADRCSLPVDAAADFLPQGGLNAFVSSSVAFDNRDDPEFPRRGVAASALLGLGLGSDYRDPVTGAQQSYMFQQVEFGVKTYLALADLFPDEVNDRNHVFAFRVNAGHQFGGDYPVSRRFLVGKTSVEGAAIRGYQLDDFELSRTYATGSVEYRYDFGLDTVATQTVIGIVFLDLGYASSVPGFPEYGAPLFAGAGLGVQVNLGFGGVVLPALRFDYGFSERNPRGEFRFRVGPVF